MLEKQAKGLGFMNKAYNKSDFGPIFGVFRKKSEHIKALQYMEQCIDVIL